MPRVSLVDFEGAGNKGLWISGPRERTPATHMRRLSAINALREREIRTRNGTTLVLPAVAAAHSASRFDDTRFQGAGTTLFRSGISIDTGYDGTPLDFVVAEPRAGTDDEFLFVCAGGKLTKVDSAGAVTKWGIDKPTAGVWGDGPGGNNERSDGVTVIPPQEAEINDAASTDGWTSSSGILSVQTDAPTPSGNNIRTNTGNDEEGTEES